MLSTSFKWYCYSVVIYYRKITIIIIIIERIIIKNDNEEIKVKRSWEAGVETQVVIYWLKQNLITKTWLMVGNLSNFTLPPPSLSLSLLLSLSPSLFLVPLSLADSYRTTWAAISEKKNTGFHKSEHDNATNAKISEWTNDKGSCYSIFISLTTTTTTAIIISHQLFFNTTATVALNAIVNYLLQERCLNYFKENKS